MANPLTRILSAGAMVLALAGSAKAQQTVYDKPGFYPEGPVEERTNGLAPGFVDYVQKGVEVKNHREPVNRPIQLGNGWSLSNWRYESFQTVEPAERHSVKWKYGNSRVKGVVDGTKNLTGKVEGLVKPAEGNLQNGITVRPNNDYRGREPIPEKLPIPTKDDTLPSGAREL